jgi:hypothetical protein
MLIGEFELTVAEDENGEGCAVQIIESRDRMKEVALGKARSFDRSLEGWSDHERRVWLADFRKDLAIYLEKCNGKLICAISDCTLQVIEADRPTPARLSQ